MDERTRLIAARDAARLDLYVSEETALSRSAVQRLIREGGVLLNDRIEKPGRAICAGDRIDVVIPEPKQTAAEAEDIALSVVYQDEWLAVVDKPQGMVVHPSPGHESGTLVNGLLFRLDGLSGIGGELRPGIVHRIDRMTSGLLVVAKNDAAHRALSDQFRDHSARRTYVAIAEGGFSQDFGTIDAPIGRHPIDRKRMSIVPNGRRAVTHWRVVERLGAFTLLQLTLETGRTHQIRVHLAAQKHPLAGDTVYGRAKPQLGLQGQALHGYELSFDHPGSGERMAFFAPIPDYFLQALFRAGSSLTGDALMETLRRIPNQQKENEE